MTPQNDLTSEQIEQLETLLFDGKKIEAIKHVRNITNMDLKTSKEFVESHAILLREAYPDKMPKQSGCAAPASMFFLALSLGILFQWLA